MDESRIIDIIISRYPYPIAILVRIVLRLNGVRVGNRAGKKM